MSGTITSRAAAPAGSTPLSPATDQGRAGLGPTGAWLLSRALCWVAGVGAVILLGAHAGPHDPLRLTSPFGGVGNTLVAPAARWDSVWYLLIAEHGYVRPLATAFYPLYPLLAKVVGFPFGSALVGGVLVSLAALLAALHCLLRLVTLEIGPEYARRTTLLLAFFPTAVFFSAVYTEGLFLALTVGSLLMARRERWGRAGVLAGLAALTRPDGILLLLPLALLYLMPQRQEPAAADRPRSGSRWRRPGWSMLWLLLVPAGFAAYMVYLGLRFDDPLAMLHQGVAWGRTFTFPAVTLARSAADAAQGLAQLPQGHLPHNIYEFAYVCLAIVGTTGALRRFSPAYGLYAAAGILATISYPVAGHSLAGFSRYMAPLFPILMWLAVWTQERRLYRPLLLVFTVLMIVNSARFATWHFVA